MPKAWCCQRGYLRRPEGVWANTVKLVGTDREKIFQEIKELLENLASYETMAQARNPYGDGQAARRIVEILANRFAEPLSPDFPCPPELNRVSEGLRNPRLRHEPCSFRKPCRQRT